MLDMDVFLLFLGAQKWSRGIRFFNSAILVYLFINLFIILSCFCITVEFFLNPVQDDRAGIPCSCSLSLVFVFINK